MERTDTPRYGIFGDEIVQATAGCHLSVRRRFHHSFQGRKLKQAYDALYLLWDWHRER